MVEEITPDVVLVPMSEVMLPKIKVGVLVVGEMLILSISISVDTDSRDAG